METDPIDLLSQQGRQALAQGETARARDLFTQALNLKGDAPDVHYGLATACFLLDDLESAAYHFREVTRLDPLRAGAQVNLGAVLNRLGDYPEAIQYLRRGIQLDPQRAEGYYNLGLVYKNTGQLKLASKAYKEATRLNPGMIDAHFNLANLYLETQRYDKAVLRYQQVLQLRPGWDKALEGLAQAEAALAGRRAEAAAADQPAPPAEPLPPAEPAQDLQRSVDPKTQGEVLTQLHQATIDSAIQGQQVLKILEEEMTPVFKELSGCLLNLGSPTANPNQYLGKFEQALERLREAQRRLLTSIARVHQLGEELLKSE